MNEDQIEQMKKVGALLRQARTILNDLYPSLDHQTKAYEYFRDIDDDVRTGIEGVEVITGAPSL